MPAQLTSVRLEERTVDRLRLLAEIDGSNVAEIIRTAVDKYIDSELSDPNFRKRVEDANTRRRELLTEFERPKPAKVSKTTVGGRRS